ncbi:protein of unknown function [Bradyrhizobium sp. ORS 285]|nr:protein of unknown function [Bradyrhizobium sp. ORS 285]
MVDAATIIVVDVAAIVALSIPLASPRLQSIMRARAMLHHRTKFAFH